MKYGLDDVMHRVGLSKYILGGKWAITQDCRWVRYNSTVVPKTVWPLQIVRSEAIRQRTAHSYTEPKVERRHQTGKKRDTGGRRASEVYPTHALRV